MAAGALERERSSTNAVQLRNVSKTFSGITVLRDVNLDIVQGEVHGLVGENGSGKSTLVKIIGGLHTPDHGSTFSMWGQQVPLPIAQPQLHGIAIIHQDLALNDAMTVSENIGVSSSYGTRTLGLYRARSERRRTRELIAELGLDLDPDAFVSSLAPAERSMVAILRALRLLRGHHDKHLLILDEPTAALTREESTRLLAMIRGLAAQGTAVMFIGHRLQEIRAVCDRISVLRSGSLVGTIQAADATEAGIVRMMLGYELGTFYPERHEHNQASEMLRVEGLTSATVADVSFQAYRGEILGITGLAGMGQDELPYLLYGHMRRNTGSVTVDGATVAPNVVASVKAGVALVPGNRQRDGVWMVGTATENLTLPFLPEFRRRGLLRRKEEGTFAAAKMRKFGVRPLLPQQEVARFSGGNQQKLVLARWLHTRPKLLLLHEPTQGVDAGAKRELFTLIREAASADTTVVIFSSDLEEVANMCHRVLVLRHGMITADIPQHQLSEDRIMAESQGNTGAWHDGASEAARTTVEAQR